MSTQNNPTVTFYTAGGEPIDNDELYLHDLTAGMVSFSGADPVTVREFSINETKTVQAWLQFLAADNERLIEVYAAVEGLFRGYPAGTTIGDIVTGKATKVLSPVEVVEHVHGS